MHASHTWAGTTHMLGGMVRMYVSWKRISNHIEHVINMQYLHMRKYCSCMCLCCHAGRYRPGGQKRYFMDSGHGACEGRLGLDPICLGQLAAKKNSLINEISLFRAQAQAIPPFLWSHVLSKHGGSFWTRDGGVIDPTDLKCKGPQSRSSAGRDSRRDASNAFRRHQVYSNASLFNLPLSLYIYIYIMSLSLFLCLFLFFSLSPLLHLPFGNITIRKHYTINSPNIILCKDYASFAQFAQRPFSKLFWRNDESGHCFHGFLGAWPQKIVIKTGLCRIWKVTREYLNHRGTEIRFFSYSSPLFPLQTLSPRLPFSPLNRPLHPPFLTPGKLWFRYPLWLVGPRCFGALLALWLRRFGNFGSSEIQLALNRKSENQIFRVCTGFWKVVFAWYVESRSRDAFFWVLYREDTGIKKSKMSAMLIFRFLKFDCWAWAKKASFPKTLGTLNLWFRYSLVSCCWRFDTQVAVLLTVH